MTERPGRIVLPLLALLCALRASAEPDRAPPGSDDDRPRISFGDAIEDWRDANRAPALRAFAALAQSGDSRSQLLLSTLMVEGKYLPRDLPQAYAWAYVAASDDVYAFGRSARPTALKVKSELERALSGADLLRGERIAQTYLSAHETDYRQKLAAARELFMGTASHPELVVRPGCAARPDLMVCMSARKELADGPRCQRQFGRSSAGDGEDSHLAHGREPAYPQEARKHAWEGVFVFAAHVDRSGYVCEIAVIKGSGYKSIDDTVLAILPSWRFEKTVEDGQPVESLATARIEHAISDYQMVGEKR